MNCPRCGGKTRVSDTRSAESPGRHLDVNEALSWYTRDWVGRIRGCTKCDWRKRTVELVLDDLLAGWKPRQ